MIAELQQAVAHYAHAGDELNVPELEAVLTEDTTWTFTCPDRECSARSPDARRCSPSP
ncbi:hypothetical protein ACFYW6_31145 [Streptomyces sp. NPDC002659]|uniref:hypothetical protein n=1 Tax=Streptomyces sp. NPDC002659 TaxID=3364656 RepID=UPI00368E61C3